MRKKILAANWKMNLLHDEAIQLYQEISQFSQNQNVYIYAPSIFLHELSALDGHAVVGAQNFYFEKSGAFTGEISLPQLESCGVKNVLIGHSERRQLFYEMDEILKKKVDAAISEDFNIIFCCGEPREVREKNAHVDFVVNQLKSSLFHVPKTKWNQIAIAYEPIWAIGTGLTASSEQAEEMHANIRRSVEVELGSEISKSLPILYGGSCNEKNANELFACENVDGGLIGGASLNSKSFREIFIALYELY
jgi:triosephosphate isomerase